MPQTEIDSTETYQPVHYAGFWIRVAAAIIDAIILSGVNFAVNAIFRLFLLDTNLGPHAQVNVTYKVATFLTSVAGPIFYECYFLASSWMGTPGMKLAGIKIVDYAGDRISLGRAFIRYLSQILSAVILFIGYFMIAFDRRKQGLHDKLAKTLVIYRQ